MFFDSLHVSNFGPFSDLQCRFSPGGINLISGPNGSGRTQLVGAILLALCGIECARQDGTAESASRVELIIREEDVSETLVREVVSRKSLTEEFRATTQSNFGLVSRPFHEVLVQSIKSSRAPSLVLPWFRPISKREIRALMRANSDKWQRGTKTEQELWASLESVASSANRATYRRFLSEGQDFYLMLALEALSRLKAIDSIPLILDHNLGLLTDDGLQSTCGLLAEIGRRSQVLLLTSRSAELAGILGGDAVVQDWLERPRPHHFSQISFRSGFLQQYGATGDMPKQRKVSTSVVPLIATEGKTDWKHLKGALAKLKTSGMYKNLRVNFWEYGDDQPMGSGELLGLCTKFARVPQLRPTIWVFDRDEPAIVRQVCDQDGKPRSWGNKVFSFAIPVPDHRSDSPDICLEFYYKDEDIKRADLNARRLFLSNEFSSKTGRHKTDKSLVCSDTRRLQRLTIIDDCVFDETERNVALTKNAFAENISRGKAGFQNVDVSAFVRIFDTIVIILRDMEDEESTF